MLFDTVTDLPAVRSDALQILTRTCRFLSSQNVPAYLVGGFVRDLLLGRDTADIDIAVSADALEIARMAAEVLGSKYIALDDMNRIGRVVFSGTDSHIDFTSFEGAIEDDLARRDFTIDAMAYELQSGLDTSFDEKNVIDPFGGREDLQRRVVRAVGDNVFRDDPVRLLRAMRIAGETGLSIDAPTEALMRRDAHFIAGAAGERVREELLRLLAPAGADRRLAHLARLGLLTALIPELAPAMGVDQPYIHVWDVFEHSIQTVAAVEFILRQAAWEYASNATLALVPWSDRLRRHFEKEVSAGSTRMSVLKLAALLHDIAKPQTKATDSEGRTRFLGHPQEGAGTAATILERLRFSKREVQLVEIQVRYHLRPTQMSQDGLPTRRAIYRYFRDTGDAGIDILFLALADHLATRADTLDQEQWRQHTAMTAYILENRYEEAPAAPPKLVDGNDIMQAFGLEPGPKIGELLEAVREARAAGEIITREQAFDYIRGWLSHRAQNTTKEST